MPFPMTNHPCPNCQFLYARLERADNLATAIRPLVENLRAAGADSEIVAAFDLYCADAIDGHIAQAGAEEQDPETERNC